MNVRVWNGKNAHTYARIHDQLRHQVNPQKKRTKDEILWYQNIGIMATARIFWQASNPSKNESSNQNQFES